MPPKKVAEPEKKPLIGRVGTNLKVGIVGVPNVGKSTFFNVMTKSQAAAENFPFCTIDPNENKYNFIIWNDKNYFRVWKMMDLKNYKNIDTADKYNIINLPINRNVIFNGNLGIVGKKKQEIKEKIAPLAVDVLDLNNTTASLPTELLFMECWSDVDAQEMYLRSKPFCYLILNKPGAGAYTLGEAISKKLNCVHLCPRNVITDEIEQGSLTGRCLDYNLRNNKVINIDIILSLLKNKLESAVVKHRGYVISGFPMVSSNRSRLYFIDKLYSEEAIDTMEYLMPDIIWNLKRNKQNIVDTSTPKTSVSSEENIYGTEEEEDAEEAHEQELVEKDTQDPPVVLPKFILESCSNVVQSKKAYMHTAQSALLQQLDALFKLSMEPDFIVYMTCPDIDLITKKSHKYVNYVNGLYTFDPFLVKKDLDIRWPQKYCLSDYENPYDIRVVNPKYCCKQPLNFVKHSTDQICNYEQYISNLIQKKFKEFNPINIIKVDARCSIYQIMYNINEILTSMPMRPVLIPEPLYLQETPEDMEEFWKVVEELNVIHDGVVKFKQYASRWFERCPVELKKRRSVKGYPKFAVTLFKHVYLLSTLDAMISFCRNPRPYLKKQYLEPTCRIIIIGTKSSGKTMVSRCLSWIFDAPIICYKKFMEEEAKKKYKAYSKTILSEIIATIEDARLVKWQQAENERMGELDLWYAKFSPFLKEYIPLLIKSLSYEEKHKIRELRKTEKILKELEKEKHTEETVNENEKEFEENENHEEEILEQEEVDIEPSDEFLNKLNDLKHRLSFLPFLDILTMCEHAAEDKDFFFKYAPKHLITVTDKPTIPVLGDKDVTQAVSAYILANDLQKETESTIEELMTAIIKILSDIDLESQLSADCDSYGKYIIDGFPSESEYWAYLIDSKTLPDHTIALIENREMEQNIIQHYTELEKHLKNYEERFFQAQDSLIITKLLTKSKPNTNYRDIQIIVHDLLNYTLDFIFNPANSDAQNMEPDVIEPFIKDLKKNREDWESLKLRLEENSKSYIEVELENKSDIEVIEEVLRKLRNSYSTMGLRIEDGEAGHQDDDTPKDIVTYNSPLYLCETNIYCPVSYLEHGVLWEGKSEFSLKYDNKIHNFVTEDCLQRFQKDIINYKSYNKPYKDLPPLRICVIGCIGSGKTTISKLIAKEFGLIHLDISERIQDYLLPRHCKKVGRQNENIFTDTPMFQEDPLEFQEDEEEENIGTRILRNEIELRRVVYNYFEKGTPIPSVLIQKFIKMIWFEEPFLTNGFVLDGYPRLPNDIEDMVASFCIPDLIIELECNLEVSLQRVSPIMIEIWKTQLNDAKEVTKIKLDAQRNNWMAFITKTVVVKLICDEILENMPCFTEPVVKSLSVESVIIDAHPTGSTNLDANLFSTYNRIIQEYPPPFDKTDWEKPDDARERIDLRLENIYAVDDENIQILKDILLEQKIKTISVDSTKPLYKVLKLVLFKMSLLTNRSESFFEQTFVINNDIAEMLLQRGFFFHSKFNRMCPVYIYENPNAIFNPYKINKRRSKIFTVAHRSYMYYLNDVDSLKKFRTNPLKYIRSNAVKSFVEYPLRIAVIGPPKSGKSSLAKKIAKKFGLLCLSKGLALRYILENMYWTELASKMTEVLREGECINNELIMKAVQVIAIDHRTVTHGIVFDGFPEFPPEAMGLCSLGIYPHIILDITAKREIAINNLQKEYLHYLDIFKRNPPYPRPYISLRFTHWQETAYRIRDWIKNDYQNLYTLDGNKSKWQCFQVCNDLLENIVNKIHYYLINVNNKIVPADVIGVSNKIFRQKMSNYKNFCPVCLLYDTIKHSDYPVDKKGVVQFKNMFYWICADHMSAVLENPQLYLSNRVVNVPEIAAVVKTINNSLLYENGICIVTYAEHLPSQKIQRGNNELAANFRASRVPVPDERYDYLCEFHKPVSKVPAFLNVVDIAGLVKGAAEGQGLGNAFLSHIKACDAIFNLCRAFEDEDVTHVDGDVNPVRDLETIGEELRLKDEEQLMQNFEKLDRAVNRGGEKKLKPEYDTLMKIKAILVDEKKHIRFGDWSVADIEILNKYLFLTSKPALYLVNLSEKDYIRKKNKWLPKLKEWIDKNDPGAPLIPFSGALETKLMDMDAVEKQAFLKEHGLTSALDKIIVQGYKALQLEYFFTAGHDEVKAWTIQKGTKAPQAAGRIHTDFEKGFIMAEVMHFKDFREEGTEAACKAAGKYRQQGRNYVVEDGDIIFFKFNAGAGLKDAKKK